MPRTFLATIQFDGTDFVGWQRQRVGRTVQQEVEAVLERLAGHPVRGQAAGRTDAGVHALGLGVSFTLPDRWTPDALQRAMNALLPRDCFATEIRETRPGFQARKHATERRYRYLIGTDPACRSPFRRPFEWSLGKPLELARLVEGSRRVEGRHDFLGFSVRRSERPHTRCDVREARWSERPGGIGPMFDIRADRFLHHMVRMLVGTMVEVALGKRASEDIDAVLAQRPGLTTSPPAPAAGLYFVNAVYPDEWFDLATAPSSSSA
jgi:tRNA pseudouridine38-40 synthase